MFALDKGSIAYLARVSHYGIRMTKGHVQLTWVISGHMELFFFKYLIINKSSIVRT